MNATLEAYINTVLEVTREDPEELDEFSVDWTHIELDGYEDQLKGYVLEGDELDQFDEAIFDLELFHIDVDLIARPNLRYLRSKRELGMASKKLEKMVRRMKKFRGVPGVKYRRTGR